MAPHSVTILFAVHRNDKTMSHDASHGWRGVLAAHYNSIDLTVIKTNDHNALKTKPPGALANKPNPEYIGYVYDPSNNYDILLNEIEGRLLEVNFVPPSTTALAKWARPSSGAVGGVNPTARQRGPKMTIMIDDLARKGDDPQYFPPDNNTKGERAFLVGLSTILGEPGKPSPTEMRYVWRDCKNPAWGTWRDPDQIDCTLIPMYYITSKPLEDLTQAPPDYKFVRAPPPFKTNQRMAQDHQKSCAHPNQRVMHRDAMATEGDADIAPIEGNDTTEIGGETMREIEDDMEKYPDDEPNGPATGDVEIPTSEDFGDDAPSFKI